MMHAHHHHHRHYNNRRLSAPPSFNTSRTSIYSRSSSISSDSDSETGSEDVFDLWQIHPPSRTNSISEGIPVPVDYARYNPMRPVKCHYAHIFRTDIFTDQRPGPGISPQVSPRGTTVWRDGHLLTVGEGSKGRAFEAKEEMLVRSADEVFREMAGEKRRETRRKERVKAKREGFRLDVAEWETLKEAFELDDEDLESNSDDDYPKRLGSWLKSALRRGIGGGWVERDKNDDEDDDKDYELPMITSQPIADSEDSLPRARSKVQSLKKRSHDSAEAETWERGKTRSLRRVGSVANLRTMHKRYDPEAESIYSQSTGTLLGEASRSLIALVDANYETTLEREPSPDNFETGYQGARACLRLWRSAGSVMDDFRSGGYGHALSKVVGLMLARIAKGNARNGEVHLRGQKAKGYK
ncbi:MAG: hypothetical protein Q9182_006017 [Xanthomendoza sp. 2 TL-2023]